MINVISKICIYQDCKVQSTYNNDGEITPLYCSKHKLEGMVDIKHKKCIYDGCKSRAICNIPSEKKGLYCSVHKHEGMEDIKHKKCIYDGCKTRANYNIFGELNALYCVTHKSEIMVNVSSKTCIYDNCKKQPTYNKEGQLFALYCFEHKIDGMINVKHKTCKSEWCNTRPHEKYDGYCMYCYMNLFPDKPVSRNYKTKERAVVDYVKTQFPDYNWIADKPISDGCSKRRPDLMIDLGYQIIIIEIDENQHLDYDCSCENKRIMELSQDVSHRPIIFIRFNPDDYVDINGTNITSCWGVNKNGICAIRKSKIIEWNDRLTRLTEQIQYWINSLNKTDKTVEIEQLFYDIQ
jgi:hypothetical protein